MQLSEPDTDLVLAATYDRTVRASVERVWENVLDWEHLPWLHARAFESVEMLDAGAWGWRARLGGAGGGAPSIVELNVDRDAGHYVVRSGSPEAKSEIWTTLEPEADEATRVSVDFRVLPLPEVALQSVGHVYVSLYTTLWDEDEEMMCERAARLAEQTAPPPDSSVGMLLSALTNGSPYGSGQEDQIRTTLTYPQSRRPRAGTILSLSDSHVSRPEPYACLSVSAWSTADVCAPYAGPLFYAPLRAHHASRNRNYAKPRAMTHHIPSVLA
jgi:hypothetical protein